MLILEFPNEKHRAAYEDTVQEWRNIETPTSPRKLFTGKDFDEFLLIVQREPTESDPAKVPAHLFLLADTESSKLFGAIQIRHHINHPNLIETGGDSSERRKATGASLLDQDCLGALWSPPGFTDSIDTASGGKTMIAPTPTPTAASDA